MITVGELIELLKDYDPKLPVAVYADHSQCTMKATHVGVQYVESLDKFMMEAIAEEDIEDYDKRTLKKVLEISAP